MSFKKYLAILAVSIGLAGPATASSVIVDTLNTRVDLAGVPKPAFNIALADQKPLGQTFTLTQDTKDLGVSAYLTSFGGGFAGDFLIFAGAGVTGTALATVAFKVADADVAGRAITFRTGDFTALGTLAAGTYTAAVRSNGTAGALLGGTPRVLSGGLFGAEVSPAVKTPGTISYGPNGVFNFRSNLSQEFGFRVTGTVAAIPLPATGLMLILALGGLGLVARRRA